MENLSTTIKESLSKDLRDQLLELIYNNKITDDEARRIIDSITINRKDLKYERYEMKLKSLGLYKIEDNIFSYFNRHGQGNKLIDYVTGNEENKIDINDILQKGNIIDAIVEETGFAKEAIERLSKDNSGGGIQSGEYEYTLRLFLQNVDIRANKNADLTTNGQAIELKCGRARIAGSKTIGAYKIREKMNERLREIGLPEVGVDRFNGKKSITNCIRFFQDTYGELKTGEYEGDPKTLLAELLVDSYTAQYDKGIRMSLLVDSLINQVKEKLFTSQSLDKKSIIKCISVISILSYQLSEQFTYLMIVNKESSKVLSLTFDKPNIINSFDDVYDFLSTDGLKIKTIPNETDNTFGKGVLIEYKPKQK